MTAGARAGATFLLDPRSECTLGRGLDCTVVLADTHSSRVHAVLHFRNGAWHVRDADSRNGTFVNGQKADDCMLADGHTIKIGGTEFVFGQSAEPPTVAAPVINLEKTETLVRQAAMPGDDFAVAAANVRDFEQNADLLLLYQLSIRLLGCSDPAEVIRIALELLRERTGASLCGFLWVDDEGQLKPKLTLPDQGEEAMPLSSSLTRLVQEEGQAVWIASHEQGDLTESMRHYADAVCAPLLSKGQMLGAIHVYLARGRFREPQFEFTISLANIVGAALARARSEESVRSDLDRLKAALPGCDEMIGESAPMRDLKSKIARLAQAGGCVLVRGESGAGKELVARAIHRSSRRADRPLLSVNCAAIPEDLMESQLFGHKKGAFTGADNDHVGYFQQADLGTLFLDEVGELPPQGQAKLLRVLEGHPFLPVGSTKEIKVDVRVIAATNQDLQTYVRQKRFREDLYYRLSVFELFIPPLRERSDDLGRLIDFFLDHFRRQHGRPALKLSDKARAKLCGYHWPGNVRQLRNVLDSTVVLAVGDSVEPSDIALRDSGREDDFDSLRIEDWERKLIGEALLRTSHNIPEAAKLLGIGRATLYRKIDEYGLKR
ncbi:MAG: sigma 54-interacting transcriptional regulator [Pirellulales bacterium]